MWPTEEQIMAKESGAANYADSITKYIIVYVCILAIAGLQFVIAYSHLDGSQMFLRMFSLALLEAGLGVVFFMHLGSENRRFVIFVAVFTLFVLGAMQYSWTDSFRMLVGAPYSSTAAQPK
jgi:heme/copper-type cytochrome/quinol oxidase subunit 4